MNKNRIFLVFLIIFIVSCKSGIEDQSNIVNQYYSIDIDKQYLNLPVSHMEKQEKMTFVVDDKKKLEFVIRLATDEPDYWVFFDVSAYNGRELKYTIITIKASPKFIKMILLMVLIRYTKR